MTANYKLPDLGYDFSALEPVISAEIMQLHYTKHHQAYVNNLNTSLDKYHDAEAKHDLQAMIALQQAIKFNGGGHANHTLFWQILAPAGQGGHPSGALAQEIDKTFGSLDQFIEKFSALTVAIQGSGWGWLGICQSSKKLKIGTTPNQDPASTVGITPILGIDVWEHAYYLQYKNVRADYVKNMWKIINWKHVEGFYSKAHS
jgi:Fe-Mn family superoxide dismutase